MTKLSGLVIPHCCSHLSCAVHVNSTSINPKASCSEQKSCQWQRFTSQPEEFRLYHDDKKEKSKIISVMCYRWTVPQWRLHLCAARHVVVLALGKWKLNVKKSSLLFPPSSLTLSSGITNTTGYLSSLRGFHSFID